MMAVRVQSGVVQPFSHYPGGRMWTGNGARDEVGHVDFPKPFGSTPQVHIALSGFDIGNADGNRINLVVTKVDKNHFEFKVGTWAGTKVASVQISWIAVDGAG